MKLVQTAQSVDNVKVTATQTSSGVKSVTLTIKDPVLGKLCGVENFGFEFDLVSAYYLIKELQQKIKWAEAKVGTEENKETEKNPTQEAEEEQGHKS